MNWQFIYRISPFFLGLFVFFIDRLSKFFVHERIPLMTSSLRYPYGGIGMFQDFMGIEFSIAHQINRGAAWGIFADYQVPLLYLRLTLITGLLVYLIFFNKHKNWTFPLALIIAGALSNVLDFFIYGHVVDMLHFILWGYDFPVFNIADSAIFIGISWLIIISAIEKKEKQALPHE